MKAFHIITFFLVIIGGLNWLLIGLFSWGIGDWLGASVARLVYVLVGLSAVYLLFSHKKDCKACSSSAM